MKKRELTQPRAERTPAVLGAESPPHEVEVKLECDPEVLPNLFAHSAFSSVTFEPRAQKLVAAYFDTQDDALDRAGMALRVRKIGARRVMTLKWTPRDERLFSRREVEVEVQGDSPDLVRFDPEIAAMVQEAIREKPLVRRFETRVRRRLGVLSLESARLEVAVDDGEIVSGKRRIAISECEFELKEGDRAALFTVAAQATDAGLRLSPAQKAERGYFLARAEHPAEVRAADLDLALDTSLEEAISVIVEANLRQFVGNWPALLEADILESVHQMRVALRRLRAALALFEKAFPEGGFEPFRSEAKRIASALGEARDQDAFGALVSSGPLKLFPNDESFAALLAASSSRRSIAYGQARQIVRAPATSRFVLELQAYAASRGWRRKLSANDLSRLAQPARIFAAEAIDRLYQRARKRGKGLMGLAPDQRHRLRISLKNLRYACDFFASVFDAPRDVKRFTKALGALQDSLGASNDAVVALKTVAELEQNAGQAAGRAVGIVMGWCGREADAPDIHLRAHWLAFKKARCFWQ